MRTGTSTSGPITAANMERDSPIVPVMMFNAKLGQDTARNLFYEGIHVIGFFFPVVPAGQARIRTQMSADHEIPQQEQALLAFKKIGAKCGILGLETKGIIEKYGIWSSRRGRPARAGRPIASSMVTSGGNCCSTSKSFCLTVDALLGNPRAEWYRRSGRGVTEIVPSPGASPQWPCGLADPGPGSRRERNVVSGSARPPCLGADRLITRTVTTALECTICPWRGLGCRLGRKIRRGRVIRPPSSPKP